LLKALAHFHAHGLVHLDIKPENIAVELIDGFPYTRLIDVDGVRFTADFNKETKFWITPEYLPIDFWAVLNNKDDPKYVKWARSWSKRWDVWSLGASVYQILFGKLVFSGFAESEYKSLPEYMNANWPTKESWIADIWMPYLTDMWGVEDARSTINFLQYMMPNVMENRPSVKQLLKHEWVQKGKIELTNFENRNKPKTRPRGFSGHESPLLQAKLHNSEPDLLKIDDEEEEVGFELNIEEGTPQIIKRFERDVP